MTLGEGRRWAATFILCGISCCVVAVDQELFGERFSDWQRPGLGFDQTIVRDE